jgi:TonB family protein
MRGSLRIGIALLVCGLCSRAMSQANPSDAQKSQSKSDLTAAAEALPKVCNKANPPPCATPPRLVSAPQTEFSERARGREFKGVSVLSVIVEPDGGTSHIQVMKGLGMGLDEKAIASVKKWRFKPAMLNGKPVAVQIAVEVAFHLY